MGFYQKHIVPPLTAFTMGQKPFTGQREKVVPLAEGRVLEIGIGAGHNLAHYDAAKIEKVWGLEAGSRDAQSARSRRSRRRLSRLSSLIFREKKFRWTTIRRDTVLTTFTVCSIPGVVEALTGMRRVLKPGGRLVFCEHGSAPDEGVAPLAKQA